MILCSSRCGTSGCLQSRRAFFPSLGSPPIPAYKQLMFDGCGGREHQSLTCHAPFIQPPPHDLWPEPMNGGEKRHNYQILMFRCAIDGEATIHLTQTNHDSFYGWWVIASEDSDLHHRHAAEQLSNTICPGQNGGAPGQDGDSNTSWSAAGPPSVSEGLGGEHLHRYGFRAPHFPLFFILLFLLLRTSTSWSVGMDGRCGSLSVTRVFNSDTVEITWKQFAVFHSFHTNQEKGLYKCAKNSKALIWDSLFLQSAPFPSLAPRC